MPSPAPLNPIVKARTESSESVERFIQAPTFVALNDSVKNAARLMAANGSSCAIVTLKDQAIGIVTEWDILTRLVILGKDSDRTPVSEIMSTPLWTVFSSTRISDAIALMLERGFRRLGVKEGNRVTGLISLTELIGNSRENSIPIPLLESPVNHSCPLCRKVLRDREELFAHLGSEISQIPS